MTPRLATALMFVVNGATVGTWIALIPAIQEGLRATATEMGFALLAAAAGALVAMPLTGQLLVRVSSRNILVGTALVFPLLAPLPLLAGSPLALALLLLVFGAANGAMDVSMNAHGVALERGRGRAILSSLHAGWSVGGLLGAGGVALAAALSIDPMLEAAAAGVGLWLLALLVSRRVGHGSVRSTDGGRVSLPSRAVLPLGVLAVSVGFVEGGLSDWSGIYLRQDMGAAPEVAATAYGAFALGMTAGRLGGDALNERLGAVGLLRAGLLLTALSLAALLILAAPLVALVGLAVAGAGVANALPLLFAAAGRVPPHGPSLSAVFTMAYTAFLAGPPIIGFVADRVGLPLTLGLLVVLAVVVALAAGRAPGLARPAAAGQSSRADLPEASR
jgi:MFS family permease